MVEKREEPIQQVPQPFDFLTELGKKGYPFADVIGKVVEISEQPDKSLRTLGFQDSNGRKIIALTASREKWAKIAEDILKS